MSSSATTDPGKSPTEAWGVESRRKMMRDVVATTARLGFLRWLTPKHVAATYGVTVPEVEAELMKHLSEGSDK